MKVKDHRQMMRSLTDPLNIPKLRALLEAHPVLTQEEFKARQSYKPGGLVEPGVTHYATKESKIIPPKASVPFEVKRMRPDFFGKFEGRKVYQQNLNDAFDVYNTIIKNKGRISSLEDLSKLTWGQKVRGQKRVKLALDLLRTSDFPEIKNFKFLRDLYPKLDVKGFKNLDMVSDSIVNYLRDSKLDKREGMAHLLPDNMVKYYRRSVEHGDVAQGIFIKMYNFDKDQIKYITDQVSKATGEPFTAKDYQKAMDDARLMRQEVKSKLVQGKIHANMNKNILKLHGDDQIQKLLSGTLDKPAQEKLLARAMKVLDTEDASDAMRRLFMLGEAYSEGKNTRTLPGINTNEKLAQKIIATQGAQKHRYALSSVLYNHYANRIDSALKATPGKSFIGYYQTRIKNLLDKGISPDEVFSVTASARRGLEPYAIFTQGLRKDVNSKIKGGNIDSALSRTHEDLQDIFKGKKWNQLTKAEKAAAQLKVETYNEMVNQTLEKVPANMRDKVQVPRFDLQNPPEKAIYNFKGRFGPTLQEQFKKSYEKIGYSMSVPKGYETQKEMLTRLEKFKPKISGAGELYSFPANLPRMWKMMGSGTRKTLGWLTGGYLEKVFYDMDKANEMSKGKSEEEAAAIALENATFGATSSISKRKYIEHLEKVAQDMGIDPRAFESVYKMNEFQANIQDTLTNYNDSIKRANDEGRVDHAKKLENIRNKFFDDKQAELHKMAETVAGQVSISKTKLPKPSLDQIAEARYNVSDMDFLRPLAEIKMVAREKLKREKQSKWEDISQRSDTDAGDKGDWLNANIFNLQSLPRATKFWADVVNPFTPLPEKDAWMSDYEKERRALKAMTPEEREIYNLEKRGLSYESPISKEAFENLKMRHKGLGYGLSKGGRASYLDGGIVSLLKK